MKHFHMLTKKKVKLFICSMILMEFETTVLYVYEKYIRIKFENKGPLCPLFSKNLNTSFVGWFQWNMKHSILISEQLINMKIGVHLPYPPPPLKKSNSAYGLQYWWNLKRNIFICSPLINENKIKECESPYIPSFSNYLNSLFAERFWLNLKQCVHMFTIFK